MPMRKYSDEELDNLVVSIAFPEFEELYECRELVDDCLAGQRAIKLRGKYLPPTKWQKAHPEKYQEFLRRALFPGETKSSLDIYEGLFQLGMPYVSLPSDGRMGYIIDDASAIRDSLKQVQVRLNKEQMAHGLRLLLLEVRDSSECPFYLQEYGANKYVRSHFTDKLISGESVCDMALLNESTIINDISAWTYRRKIQLRILGLDRNMEYYQRVVSPDELQNIDISSPPKDSRTVYPAYLKKRYNKIPLVWCGSSSLSATDLEYPPMLTMANLELKLFLCMAHNSQHIYMNTQESIVITGASNNFKLADDEFVAGSVIAVPGSNVKVQYLSTNGIGFDAEEKEIERIQNSIEEKRLSLMTAKSHQSSDVITQVQSNQSAPLRTVVNISGEAITASLRHMARWMGYSENDVRSVRYTPSTEFADPRVNLSEYIALCKAVTTGDVQLLEEDLYMMGRESGYIRSKLSWEQFKRRYDFEWDERQRKQVQASTEAGNPFSNTQTTPEIKGISNNEIYRQESELRTQKDITKDV